MVDLPISKKSVSETTGLALTPFLLTHRVVEKPYDESHINLIYFILIMIAYIVLLTSLASAYALVSQSATSSRVSMRHSSLLSATQTDNVVASGTTLKNLCEISRDACEAVSPMLKAFYAKIRFAAGDSSTAKLKSDSTFFSIADGIVQHMFIEYLFSGNKFGQIVGEEDETTVNILKKPYMVDDLVVPEEFDELIESTLEKIKKLSTRIDSKAYKGITVFVDPIDGTREFATGKGECVTMLIGYNDEKGVPAAGIMYRPLTEPVTWAAGSKRENCVMGNLDMATQPKPKGLLITDGKVSKFIENLITELGFEKVPSLASGNRAMMLLEGKAGAYIRDTGGFAKWDTSGPQAVIEAYGGTMSKLPEFMKDKSLVSYTHLKTTKNLDFEPNVIGLTLSNSKDKSIVKKGTSEMVADVDMVKEYSCLRGLVALDKGNMDKLDMLQKAMLKVAAEHPPTYT